MGWLDRLPLFSFGVIAVLLAFAPFLPQPHLLEKLIMLASGELTKLVDIFDLLLHGAPITLFVIKLIRRRGKKQ